MMDLADVTVTAYPSDVGLGGHSEISVMTGVGLWLDGNGWDHLGGEPNPEAVIAAADYMRGLLARVACMAAHDLDIERAIHGCTSTMSVERDGKRRPVNRGLSRPHEHEIVTADHYECHVTMDEESVHLLVMVPNDVLDIWVDHIHAWLEAVLP